MFLRKRFLFFFKCPLKYVKNIFDIFFDNWTNSAAKISLKFNFKIGDNLFLLFVCFSIKFRYLLPTCTNNLNSISFSSINRSIDLHPMIIIDSIWLCPKFFFLTLFVCLFNCYCMVPSNYHYNFFFQKKRKLTLNQI